jgi:hypothetical protein
VREGGGEGRGGEGRGASIPIRWQDNPPAQQTAMADSLRRRARGAVQMRFK